MAEGAWCVPPLPILLLCRRSPAPAVLCASRVDPRWNLVRDLDQSLVSVSASGDGVRVNFDCSLSFQRAEERTDDTAPLGNPGSGSRALFDRRMPGGEGCR